MKRTQSCEGPLSEKVISGLEFTRLKKCLFQKIFEEGMHVHTSSKDELFKSPCGFCLPDFYGKTSVETDLLCGR